MGVCLCSFTQKIVRNLNLNNNNYNLIYINKKLQEVIKKLSDINIDSSHNLKNQNENEINTLFIKTNNTKEKKIHLKNKSDKNQKVNIQLSPISDSNRKIEEDNLTYIKSSTYNIGEGITVFQINNFNDSMNINQSAVKKSKTCKEETINNINRLNIQYRFNNNNNGPNRLATVLETINEVSNSKVDSSELSDDNNNNENNNENNILENNIIESNNNNEIINIESNNNNENIEENNYQIQINDEIVKNIKNDS